MFHLFIVIESLSNKKSDMFFFTISPERCLWSHIHTLAHTNLKLLNKSHDVLFLFIPIEFCFKHESRSVFSAITEIYVCVCGGGGRAPPLINIYTWWVWPVILWASLKKRHKKDDWWGGEKNMPAPIHIVISKIALIHRPISPWLRASAASCSRRRRTARCFSSNITFVLFASSQCPSSMSRWSGRSRLSVRHTPSSLSFISTASCVKL